VTPTDEALARVRAMLDPNTFRARLNDGSTFVTPAEVADIRLLLAALDESRKENAELHDGLVAIERYNLSGGKDVPAKADASFKGEAVKMFATMMVEWFRECGGQNFVTIELGDPREHHRYILTMQKKGARSVDEKYLEVCAERDELRSALDAARQRTTP